MSDIADALGFSLLTTASKSPEPVLTFKSMTDIVNKMKNQYFDDLSMKLPQRWCLDQDYKIVPLPVPQLLGNKTKLMVFDEYQGEDKNMDACSPERPTPFTHALNRAKPEIAVIEQLAREAGRAEVRREQLYDVQNKLAHTEHALEREVAEHTSTLGKLDRQISLTDNWYRRAATAENRLAVAADKKRKATLAAKKTVAKKTTKKN